MPDETLPDLTGLPQPDLTTEGDASFMPWEQRLGPGMGGSAGPSGGIEEGDSADIDRYLEEVDRGFTSVLDDQAALGAYPSPTDHITPTGDLSYHAVDNVDLWHRFQEEALYDTRRVTLEHFHLFEWFPRAPGKYHTPEARRHRRLAFESMERGPDGRTYFSPLGKAQLVTNGGVGAVRLRPRQMPNASGALEMHYFMTASSNGVCHQGFPILVPRRFYGLLKPRFLSDGVAPVTLSGEMRYIPDDVATLFSASRDIPRLYLVVDELEILPQPRSAVTAYLVSVAVSFVGNFQGRPGIYLAFGSFDPAQPNGLDEIVRWLETYVVDWHAGAVLTDFDETRPHFANFPQAAFSLTAVMQGQLDMDAILGLLPQLGLDSSQLPHGADQVALLNNYVRDHIAAPPVEDLYSVLEMRVFARQGTAYPVELRYDEVHEFAGEMALDGVALRTLAADPEAYGRRLGETLFAGPVGAGYRQVTAAAERADEQLRVRLRLPESAEAPELHAIAWERLYHPYHDQWQPLATLAQTPFSRFLRVASLEPYQPVAVRPLKLLAVIASPATLAGASLYPIPAADRQALLDVLGAGDGIDLTVLASDTPTPPTRQALQAALAAGFDVVHCLCHGALLDDETYIYLENGDGSADPVPSARLIELFYALAHKPALVVLMSCETAKQPAHPTNFLALGPALVRDGGVEAVISMAESVAMSTAHLFTQQFYRQLATHGVVDRAMNEARASSRDAWDWSAPVLVMRTHDGRLFTPAQPD